MKKNGEQRKEIERVRLAAQGDEPAMDEILDEYKNLVRSLARRCFLPSVETDDLAQEGMIGLYYAVKHYDESKGMSFKNYACLCVKSRLRDMVKKQSSQTPNQQLNEDFFEWEVDPEEGVLSAESSKELLLLMGKCLSSLEYRVFTLYLEGCSISEICTATRKDAKSVDNAVQRSKQKLRVFLQEKREK